jgi:hypothetical protein
VSRGRRRAAAGRPPTEFTVRHRDSSRNSYNNTECQELGGFREVESPNGVRFGRGLRRRTPPRGGGTKIDVRRGCADRGILGEPPKSAKNGFSPPAKNPHRVPRRAPGGGRRGSGRGSVPSGLLSLLAGAGRRGKENRKTGKKRRFSTTVRKIVPRHRSKRRPTDAAEGDRRVGAIGVDRGPSGEKWDSKNGGKKSKIRRFGGNIRNRRRTGRRRRRATKLGGRTGRRVGHQVKKFRPDRMSGSDAGDVGAGPPVGRGGKKTNRRGRPVVERVAGGARTRETRGSTASDASTKPNKKKIAKIGEGVRKLSTIRRASKSGFVRRRPHAGYDGHAQRHRTPRRSSRQTAAALAQWAERRTFEPEVAGSIPRTDFSFFSNLRSATTAKSRKRIDNHSQPPPSVDSSTVHDTNHAPCGHTRESSIATRGGGHCTTTTTTTSRKIKPEIASSAE